MPQYSRFPLGRGRLTFPRGALHMKRALTVSLVVAVALVWTVCQATTFGGPSATSDTWSATIAGNDTKSLVTGRSGAEDISQPVPSLRVAQSDAQQQQWDDDDDDDDDYDEDKNGGSEEGPDLYERSWRAVTLG